jgi:hypothetical protein
MHVPNARGALIIENIAGAEDTTGSIRAMRANADGYTILKVITFCRHQAGLNTDVPFALQPWPFGLLLWVSRDGSVPAAVRGNVGFSGIAANDVMGQQETHAPQQEPWAEPLSAALKPDVKRACEAHRRNTRNRIFEFAVTMVVLLL